LQNFFGKYTAIFREVLHFPVQGIKVEKEEGCPATSTEGRKDRTEHCFVGRIYNDSTGIDKYRSVITLPSVPKPL
jgi:hypothetical protein